MSSSNEKLESWIPRTKLGRMILEGKISSIEELFMEGQKIREPEIVDVLLPDLGNRDGYVGLGSGKARQVRSAIEKAAVDARLKITPVRRGCGSWECGCGKPHTLPFQVRGSCGGVEIVLIPGPRGLGIVASGAAKVILGLAGVKDCWTQSYGSTRTVPSFAFAVFDAIKKTYLLVTPGDWVS